MSNLKASLPKSEIPIHLYVRSDEMYWFVSNGSTDDNMTWFVRFRTFNEALQFALQLAERDQIEVEQA